MSRTLFLGLDCLERRVLLSAFTPAQVRHAYGFDQILFTDSAGHSVAGDGAGQTIAIVDAYNDPNIAADLKVFDARYGLPAASLTVATPQGRPATDAGWSLEMALDVQWAHAIAPQAKLLLVESASASLSSMLAAVDYARAQPGVSVVSMSWGGSESPGERTLDSHFTTPANHGGVTFVASSGDSGAGAQWPSASPQVLSVGGTSLTVNASSNWAGERAWALGGGGVSAFEPAPTYQIGVTGSSRRSTPDVAYLADPATGVAVYSSVPLGGRSGWFQVGGTSAGAPQWAGLIAIADQGLALAGKASLDGASQTLPAIYHLPAGSLHDITAGSNGFVAGPGYDLATGLGTPLANLVVKALVSGTSGTGSGGGGGSGGSGGGVGGFPRRPSPPKWGRRFPQPLAARPFSTGPSIGLSVLAGQKGDVLVA